MGIKLESALSDYLALVRELSARAKERNTDPGNLVVLNSERQLPMSIAERAGSGQEFDKLVGLIVAEYSDAFSKANSTEWKNAVQNFFRRSRLYQDICTGDGPADADVRRL